MSERGRDWRTILLAVGCVAGAFAAVLLAASMTFYSALAPVGFSFGQTASSPLDVLIPATAICFMGALALPAAYYSIHFLAGGSSRVSMPARLRIWQGVVLFLLWIGSAWLAGFLVDKNPWRWLTPGLYLLAVGIPVYFLLRLAAGELRVGSVRRFWGLLSTGMVAGPGLAIFVELGFALVIGVGAVFYLILNPAQLSSFRELAGQLNSATTMDQMVNLLGPILDHPITFILALLFFSGFAPVVEEASKSVAVWAVFDRLDSSAQGFVAGALSGAGFGLLESLLASATPDQNWAFTLLIRGGSSMMHIMAASLTGWGIARFHLTRRLVPMLGAYAVAVILHSLWNASIVTITFGGLQVAFGPGGSAAGSTILIGLGGTLLSLLCISIPVALARINSRFRSAIVSLPAEPAPTPPPAEIA